MHTSFSLVALTLLASTTIAQDAFEPFEGGMNEGAWSFRVTTPDVIETSGGNPGGWLHNSQIDSFAPMCVNTASSSCFTGDFRAKGVTSIEVDAITNTTNFPVMGFEFSLLLRDTKGTSNVNDDDYAYFVGPEIPLPGAGWKSFSFSVPSASTAATPAGWSGGWVGDCCGFRPGVDWNDVITNVDQIEFWWLNPSFFAIFQQWNVGVDNIRLTSAATTTSRNGTGVNPNALTATNTPVIGQTWSASVDLAATGAGSSYLAISKQSIPGTVLSGVVTGELLILPPFLFEQGSLTGLHDAPVPLDCSFTGASFSAQAVAISPGNFQLTNAIDFTIGNL